VSALGTLGQGDSASVFAPIVSALKDLDPIVRRMAVTALGKLSDTRIHDLLLELLKNPDGDVRSAAVLTLAQVGDERALPALTWIQQNDTGSSGANKIKDHATYALQHIQERQQKRQSRSVSIIPGRHERIVITNTLHILTFRPHLYRERTRPG
jgi:HEAT repeat protein